MDEIRINNFLYPYVRFFNAFPQNQNIDFYLGNALVASNIAYGVFSPYIKVSKGKQNFMLTKAGSREVLATAVLNFEDGEVYTVAAADDDGKAIAYGIKEPTERSDIDYGHIRVCQLSPDLGKADVIANQYKILGDIDYLELSKYICISPGRYDFNIKQSNDEKSVLNVSAQNMKPGVYNTLYIIGLNDGTPRLTGVLSVDAASYTGYYL